MAVMASQGDVDVIEQACKRAIITSAADQAQFLLDTIGGRMSAAAIGLADSRAVRAWAEGGAVKEEEVRSRLQELFQVVWALSEAFSPAVAAAFLRGTNPHLGDRAPLVVLATEPPEDAGPQLLAAARFVIQ